MTKIVYKIRQQDGDWQVVNSETNTLHSEWETSNQAMECATDLNKYLTNNAGNASGWKRSQPTPSNVIPFRRKIS